MSQLEQLEAHLSTGRQLLLTPTQFRFAEPVRAASLAKSISNETTHADTLTTYLKEVDSEENVLGLWSIKANVSTGAIRGTSFNRKTDISYTHAIPVRGTG
ncbi:hypothetical protein CDAR_474621 [Caerostris darwini]|uniref:Uncharacterized protein n=1 Tax=Caerostris darwini TaxID=1538125 RepID=A0AAV4PMS7_9ARAC|nr:hypothetical protein CDAR_474621 [Caerostris darwini]